MLTASPASAEVSPLEVKEYQADLGVSYAEAEANLEAQRRGAHIVAQLQKALGDSYAGVWFDNEAGEFVVPLLLDADRAAVASTFAKNSLRNDYRTAQARFSWVQLSAAQAQLDNALQNQLKGGLVATSLDPGENAVIVHRAEDAGQAALTKIRGEVAEAGGKAQVEAEGVDSFDFETMGCSWEDAEACSSPYRAGVGIFGGSEGACTGAFKAYGNSGGRYVLTAGHCGGAGTSWKAGNSSPVYLGNAFVALGTTEQSKYDSQGDWAKINVTGSGYWDITPWPAALVVWDFNPPADPGPDPAVTESYPIYGTGSSYVGLHVCHSGITTGSSCGYVTELNKSIIFRGGMRVNGLTEFGPACADHGDSGGPVFAGNLAYGIYKGGDDGVEDPERDIPLPVCRRYSVYHEIGMATADLGVSVANSDSQPSPTVETKPVSDLTETQVKLNATVNPNGQWTTYHFEWGKTTNYGHIVPIPDGNIGGGRSTAVAYDTIGVMPRTRYHYRIVATNASGTSYGEDKTFTTGVRWILRNSNTPGGADRAFWYGVPGEKRFFGDWDGNGTQTPGTYIPSTGEWRLRNSVVTYGPPQITFRYGGGEWETPVVGDWDDNGTDTVGVYDKEPGNWNLRNSNSAGSPNYSFQYGGGAWETAVVGNWDGRGTDTIGVYDKEPGNFNLRNCTCGGNPDYSFQYGGGPWTLAFIGDWNGDGTDTIGVNDPSAGNWNMRDSNSSGGANHAFQFGGGPQFTPIVGDWDSNGTTTPGLADVGAGTAIAWQLRNANSGGLPQIVFDYGEDVQTQVVGDWDGDGDETVGRYNPDTGEWWLRNSNSEGGAEFSFRYGGGPWRSPIAGDWDGDGDETIGVYDPVLGNWNLRNSNTSGDPDIAFDYGGGPWKGSIVGDWNGDGIDTIGVYDPIAGNWNLRNSNTRGDPDYSFDYGGGVFTGSIVGDWDADGDDTIGVYDPQAGNWNLRNSNTRGAPDISFQYGGSQFRPVVGDWDRDGDDTAGLVTFGLW